MKHVGSKRKPQAQEVQSHSPVNIVIDQIGGGWFQVVLTLYTGLYWIADAAETTTMTYLTPSVKCYWGSTSGQASLLASIAFIGQIIGFYMCGSLGDLIGRQKILIISAFWLLAFSIACAAAPTYAWMVFFRLCVGMGMGSMPVTYTLLAECLPTKHRGIYLSVVHAFWGVGAMLCAGIAWGVMPSLGFRWLLALTAVPAGLILICCWFVPESPYWLHVKGRVEEAEAVLRRIARVNGYKGELNFNKPPPDDAESAATGRKAEVVSAKAASSLSEEGCCEVELMRLGSEEGEPKEGGCEGGAPAALEGRSPSPADPASPAAQGAGAALPASPFDSAASGASSWRSMVGWWPQSSRQVGPAPPGRTMSAANSQITVTWSQRGMHVRSQELQRSQHILVLSRAARLKGRVQAWLVHTGYDFRKFFSPTNGRLVTSLAMIAIWFMAQTASYGTTQTVVNLQTQSSPLVCVDGKPELASTKYRDVFTATAADIIATLLLVFFIETRLGRKWLYMLIATFWGTVMFVLTAPLGHDAQEAFIWLARGANAATIVVMNVMTPEHYPTSFRSFAVGLIESISRLGGFITPYIVNAFHDAHNDNGCLYLFGSLAFAAAVVTLLLRDYTGVPLEDYDQGDEEDIK